MAASDAANAVNVAVPAIEIMDLFGVGFGQAGADLSLSRDRFRLTRLKEEEGY